MLKSGFLWYLCRQIAFLDSDSYNLMINLEYRRQIESDVVDDKLQIVTSPHSFHPSLPEAPSEAPELLLKGAFQKRLQHEEQPRKAVCLDF